MSAPVTEQASINVTNRLAMIDIVDKALDGIDDLDPMNLVLNWEYSEPVELQDAHDSARRRAALAWLARHNRGLQAIAAEARKRGMKAEVAKVADSFHFGLRLYVWEKVGVLQSVSAVTPASLTCEMRPTGKVETIPATEAREVPVMEKVCPESIFAGIQDEVSA